MNIMAFILWFITTGNALFAQGWTYDLKTGKFVPPAGVSQPAPTPPPEVIYGPGVHGRTQGRGRVALER